ncbi:glycine cleavage system aminomethyltransferase T [Halovivax asiaticus JCM 14624]|uniref:Probable aminomethyltransferase n=1 Tax=Halovivax asiaticus JCM 14624 TaxID=1227490 RepID=M0BV34_9EURY|nr:glycine cleavage system aminomethyltransferase GcvT [Halovivax asiaticus]ELZ14268.1 glycine cleavage system aminomethyltransferase T [Halovivax asiaticus JCM 14624]
MSLNAPPLRDVHDERGASFTEFGGWEMPVEFDSIRTEHEAVREDAGIFDVSHMGQLEVTGPDGRSLLNRLTSNDVSRLKPGDSQYSTILAEDGSIIDDTVIYRLPDRDGNAAYLFVPNAGTDDAMTERFQRHRDEWDLDADVANETTAYGMVAVQGPRAPELVAERSDDADAIDDIGRFEATYVPFDGVECWTARTGYTGEDGFELVFPADDSEEIWTAFADDCRPCGLGSRDTLRLEAGLLLSGQDFDQDENPRTPYEAGIGFTVSLDTDFVGRDALAKQHETGADEELVGFVVEGRGIARHGHDVVVDDEVVGTVTSGTMSPTLSEAIGLAYVPVEYAEPGTEIGVRVRDRTKKAKVAPIPFIDTE